MDNRSFGIYFSGALKRIVGTLHYVIIGFAISGIGASAMAEELLVEFVGDRSKLTDEFEIEGPWLLDWHVSGEYAESTGIEVDLVDGLFLNYQGVVLKTRQPGGGTKLFNDSGRFRFRIIATGTNWRLRVSRITEEEAKRMVPVKK